MNDRNARQFWTWFLDVGRRLNDPAFVSELDRQLAVLGISDWEAGPLDAKGEKLFLAFSPTERSEIPRLEAIVAQAPSIAGWEILVGKPRKFWDRVFKWSSSEIQIDASEWRCVVLQYSDGLCDIVILDPSLPQSLHDQKQSIVEFAIKSEIGEALALARVCGIYAESPSDSAPIEASIPICALYDTLNSRNHRVS